jgi:hypothetical protein
MINSNAQTGLNFQGVARTSNNVILASQDITIKLSILKTNATGAAEYTEIRKVTTNAQGLFTAVIGDTGAISTLGNFNNINWKLSPKFLKIEMDPAAGNNFITMGTTQFQYVAYAQFAKSVDAENIVGILPVSKGGTGFSTITELKSALAIDKINNTADADKPISTKTQTALDLIAVTATDTTRFLKRINSKADTADVSVINKTLGTKLNAADTIKFTKQTYSDSSLLTKLKISDTSAMLSSRIKRDTLNLSNRINLKANTTDLSLGLELKESISNKSTATDLGGTSSSDVLFPTQKAVKEYVAANNAGGGVADGGITNIKLADLAVTDAKVATGISKSKVGLGNVENTTLSTWVGTNNITTLGTITTGTWSGTTIAIASGGTGVATTTANSFFAGPNGSAGAPSFRTLVASDLPTISTSYIQNTPDATQTGTIDISGNAKIGTALNVNGIYIGIGRSNQSTNTAIGNTALQGIDDGSNNTTIGNYTMKENNGGYNNTSVGANALQKLSNGNDNTALGYYAMLNSTTGKFNTATGSYALSSNTGSGNTGSYNVANGYNAMLYNQTGSKNVGVGYYALLANRTGSNNTAIGNQADVASGDLTNATAIGNGAIVNASNTIQVGNSSVTLVNTSGGITAGGTITANAGVFTNTTISGNENVTGHAIFTSDIKVNNATVGLGPGGFTSNTVIGGNALGSNTYGDHNVAIGEYALYKNIDGQYNIGIGDNALKLNTGGLFNLAFGTESLFNNTNGQSNFAAGYRSLYNNVGNFNLAIGKLSLLNNTSGYNNIGIGTNTLSNNTTGTNNTAIGDGANVGSSSLTNATAIGKDALVNASNTIQLGNTSVTLVNTSGGINATGTITATTVVSTNDIVVNGVNFGIGSGRNYTNAVFGTNAFKSNITGAGNIAIGENALFSNISGSDNLALGRGALKLNTDGYGNVAFNYNSLFSNTTGNENVAFGFASLYSNTEGEGNVAFGNRSLYSNLTGKDNIAFGYYSLNNNTTGYNNFAFGSTSLSSNITGHDNFAVGQYALKFNTTGNDNIAAGWSSLTSNTTGLNNIAIGANALTSNTTGSYNTAIGNGANVASGTLSNSTVIGNGALVSASNTIVLGNSSIATLKCQVTSITSLSDRRDKADIINISEGLDFVKQLRPVSFTWNTRDKAKVGIKSAGFIAQDLLALQKASSIGANLDLVSEDNPEKLEARYGNLLPVMVKAIQEQQAIIEDQKKRLEALEKLVSDLINKK